MGVGALAVILAIAAVAAPEMHTGKAIVKDAEGNLIQVTDIQKGLFRLKLQMEFNGIVFSRQDEPIKCGDIENGCQMTQCGVMQVSTRPPNTRSRTGFCDDRLRPKPCPCSFARVIVSNRCLWT